jgi:hypothetical protein
LVIKAGTKNGLEQMVPLMIDLYKNGALTKEDFGLRGLKGNAPVNKGLCDVTMAKPDLAEFLHRWGAEQKFPSHVLDAIREASKSLEDFRKKCGWVWKSTRPSAVWKSGWKPSYEAYLNIYETVVFSTEYDEALLTAIASGKSKGKDIFEIAPFKDLLEEAIAMLKEETAAEGTDPVPATDPLPGGEGDPAKSEDEMDASQHRLEAQGISGDVVLKEAAAELTDDEGRKLERFKRQAIQQVSANVTLADETMDDDKILEILSQCPAGKARGEPGNNSHVLIWYDQQDAGEATAQPHLRIPPLRNKGKHLERFLKLCLGRVAGPGGTYDELEDGDVYVINDAGRTGNKASIANSFHNSRGHVSHRYHHPICKVRLVGDYCDGVFIPRGGIMLYSYSHASVI